MNIKPLCFVSPAGYSWDTGQKLTKLALEVFHDLETYAIFENGIRRAVLESKSVSEGH